VILSFDGHAIDKFRDLPILVADTPAKHAASVHVWRNSGETNLSVTTEKMPANPQLAEKDGASQNALGLDLSPLNSDWRQKLKLGEDVQGVVVANIAEDSPFAELGLQRGDVIESINQQKVTTPEDAAARLDAAKKDPHKANVLLLLNRNGVNQYVALSMNDQGNG
jgi:serine protease Do